MEEKTIVRQNMMDDKNYRPYCGGDYACSWPRVNKDFICPECKNKIDFAKHAPDFWARYKKKHGID